MTNRILTIKSKAKTSLDSSHASGILLSLSTRVGQCISKILHEGIDDGTPAFLVDRIVYSNGVCIIGTFINLAGFQANMYHGYFFYAFWNCVYQAGIFACWLLNRRKFYLAGRLCLITALYVGMLITSAVQGTSVQMEHFLLAFAALAFTLFHPSERKWAWIFGSLSAISYLVLIDRDQPLLNLGSISSPHTAQDLRINQFLFVGLYIPSLIGLSNAYARATKVADRQRARLYEANKMASLGQMAGGIAHEINNPLAIIHALSERLTQQAKNQEINREGLLNTAVKLQSTTKRIVHIIQGLQLLSRNGEKDPFVATSINQIIGDTVSLCHERFKSMGIELHITRAPSGTAVDCRAVQISQVLLNLLNNACDAVETQTEKWVQVEARDLGSEVMISVRNGGEKIPPAIQEKLFQPFFTTKGVGRGTGLGLCVSLAMMRKHHGSIRLDRQDPHTCFVVKIPKVHDAAYF